jgi:hypothetical protein
VIRSGPQQSGYARNKAGWTMNKAALTASGRSTPSTRRSDTQLLRVSEAFYCILKFEDNETHFSYYNQKLFGYYFLDIVLEHF